MIMNKRNLNFYVMKFWVNVLILSLIFLGVREQQKQMFHIHYHRTLSLFFVMLLPFLELELNLTLVNIMKRRISLIDLGVFMI